MKPSAVAVGREVLAWLRARTPAMVALLEELANAESPTFDPAAQRRALGLLEPELVRAGLTTRLIDTAEVGPHLYARRGTRRPRVPRQLLVGHVDTVWPVGTTAHMPVQCEDGRLHGPGVYDMKGGLVQLVFALQSLAACGIDPTVEPVVLVNCDEEVGSRTSARWIRLLAQGATRAFVLEPGQGPDGMLKTARKGIARYELVVRGRAAHASTPEEGVSAIVELSHQIQRLFALNDPARGITVNVGAIDGGLRSNVVAAVASALIDVRVPSYADARAVDQAIRGLQPVTEGIVLAVRGELGRPPMEATDRNRSLFARAAEIADDLGFEVVEAPIVGGGSDANTTSQYTATLDGLGPVGAGSHAPIEHVLVERMPDRAALLALLIASPPDD